MIYLSGSTTGLAEAPSDAPVGLLVQPGSGLERQLVRYRYWAADNGCFAQGDSFDPDAWIEWLERLRQYSGCLFATAPDVVGDMPATLKRSQPWLAEIRALGFPAALVAQDGAEFLQLPWDTFDVLFIGGTTKWKLGGAALVAAEAHRRGVPVHMGRVNSLRRLQAAVLMGCSSVDGTFLAFRARAKGNGDPATRGLPELLEWLRRLEAEPFLPWEVTA